MKAEQKKIDDDQKLVELSETLGIEIGGLSYDELDDQYDEMLNEITPEHEILGVHIEPAKFLKENDPIAYRCGKCDWLDSQTTDGILIELNEQYLTPDELDELKENLKDAIDDLY